MSEDRFSVDIECIVGRDRTGKFGVRLLFEGVPDRTTAERLAEFLERVVRTEVQPVLEGDEYRMTKLGFWQ